MRRQAQAVCGRRFVEVGQAFLICFTRPPVIRQRVIVRSPLVMLAFVATTVCSQDQDRRLIDRLLRPNLDLQNPQQGKVFHADSKGTTQRGMTTTFVLKLRPKEKTFGDSRHVETKEYRSRSNRADASQQASLQIRQANVQGQLTTPSARGARPAYDTNLEIPSRRYADERAFPNPGKSQKSLDRQNPPLTIDQVRELLNKNK